MRQILINLINNAIKFSGGLQRRGKVSMRALLVEGNPEQVTLDFHVADNGIGMDEATRVQLFTAFSQADSSTTRTYGGTGLGLAISRQLVNLMGGEITMHSELDKGSLFSLRIPFKLLSGAGRDAYRPLRQAQDSQIGMQPELQGLACLVAGGAKSLFDDLAVYLTHAGAQVERAADLAAAKDWIGRRPPGLCIVVIDAAGIELSLAASLLDSLRTASRADSSLEVRFVAIGRGGRQRCRVVEADLVELDAEVMHRRAFLNAVAIAAGWTKQVDLEGKHRDADVKHILTREEARLGGRLILVAEDNEINQRVILQQLALLGQTADIADNGREALKRWQSGDYAILLADLHMPEMDGYELTAAIRAAEKTAASETSKAHIPIIAFTANALKGEAEHCLAIGMDDYLSKPVQLANLKAMLEKWLPLAVESAPVETIGKNTVRAEPVEACPEPVEAAHSPFDKLRANGLQTSVPVPVDVNVLKELIGDDEAMIREFLHDFRHSAGTIAAELRTACALSADRQGAGQANIAGALAHKLKSSARSVGALGLGDLCAEMEKAGKGGDMKALAAILPRFDQELASVEGYLEGV